MTVTIRMAVDSDAPTLAEFGARTFFETYIAGHAQHVVDAHIARAFSPPQQARELADPAITTLVGVHDSGELIAFAQWRFSPAPECVVGPRPAELWRLYVDRAFHGRGIAQRLLDRTLESAYGAGVGTLWVGVWARNTRALAFYRKHGFVDVGLHPYVMVGEVQDDVVLAHRSIVGERKSSVMQKDFEIREFAAADEDEVIALWQACDLVRSWNNPRKDIAQKRMVCSDLFLVGVIHGTIVATVMAGYDGHRGSINYLAVSPEWRRRGFGRAMMREVERRLSDAGCPKINLLIRRTNMDIAAFYAALGYYEDDVVSMGKRIEHDEPTREPFKAPT